MLREYEHPADTAVMKCQLCGRVAGPPRAHEEPELYGARVGVTADGPHNGTKGRYREGCRCAPCTAAMQAAQRKSYERRKAREAAA